MASFLAIRNCFWGGRAGQSLQVPREMNISIVSATASSGGGRVVGVKPQER